MNKFCIHCKHFEWAKDAQGRSYGGCANPASAKRVDLVTGHIFDVSPSDIYVIRGPDGACGLEGKFFEAKT